MAMAKLLQNRYSFIAGAFAAGGSFFGKLPSYLTAAELLNVDALYEEPAPATLPLQKYAEFVLLTCLPIGVMVVCNVLNWRYFLKALASSDQSLMATVLTACSNYVVSFLLGFIVYGEPITWLSSLGVGFMLVGLWFICDAQQEVDSKAGGAEDAKKKL